ncbi:hypothetical protein HNR14_003626 [Leifsonia naganoensis]|uniref:Uncharacterized protein n=1 Tax=Leifsonia naganoensis TaxID=150025 RepID=A0A853DYM4_9MICO|nr:hypothetical protein [Leifsonia naganoensis]
MIRKRRLELRLERSHAPGGPFGILPRLVRPFGQPE